MKKLLSIHYTAGAFNFAMLLLRLSIGLLMLQHGMGKISHFNEYAGQFYNFLGMGPKVSLILVIFAEVFCSFFIILGLFTRIALVPLIITMGVAFFSTHKANIEEGEMALLYLITYLVLLLVGPGRISVDGMIKK